MAIKQADTPDQQWQVFDQVHLAVLTCDNRVKTGRQSSFSIFRPPPLLRPKFLEGFVSAISFAPALDQSKPGELKSPIIRRCVISVSLF